MDITKGYEFFGRVHKIRTESNNRSWYMEERTSDRDTSTHTDCANKWSGSSQLLREQLLRLIGKRKETLCKPFAMMLIAFFLYTGQ